MAFLKKVFSCLFLISTLLLLAYPSFLEIKANKKENELSSKIITENKYYAILEIPKINLQKELYPINNSKNNLNKNLLLHEKSRMPDNTNSNVIIAGHSGTSNIAYFKNLYKIKIKDIVRLYYYSFLYTYEIKEINFQPKTGILKLKENYKNTLTLITCTKNDNTKQTIYYGELKNKEKIVKK